MKLKIMTMVVISFAVVGVFSCSSVLAKPYKGHALIENGNINQARETARRDAMRKFVEAEVGTLVQSSTQVVNMEVVSDRISADSRGCVLVKKIISQKQKGDIFEIVMDLEAGRTPVAMALEDIKTQLRLAGSSSSRSGINVALVNGDDKGDKSVNTKMQQKLQAKGYKANVNETAFLFLSKYLGTMSDYEIDAWVRKNARNSTDRNEANAILRGKISIYSKAEPVAMGQYKATAHVSAEIIGYDSSRVDSVDVYASAVGDKSHVEEMAREAAINKAVEDLAEQSAFLIQEEQGMAEVKTTLIFPGITNNKAAVSKIIKTAIVNANCSIIRSTWDNHGAFVLFVSSSNTYNTVDALKDGVLDEINKKYPNAIAGEENDNVGTTKYVFKLWG